MRIWVMIWYISRFLLIACNFMPVKTRNITLGDMVDMYNGILVQNQKIVMDIVQPALNVLQQENAKMIMQLAKSNESVQQAMLNAVGLGNDGQTHSSNQPSGLSKRRTTGTGDDDLDASTRRRRKRLTRNFVLAQPPSRHREAEHIQLHVFHVSYLSIW